MVEPCHWRVRYEIREHQSSIVNKIGTNTSFVEAHQPHVLDVARKGGIHDLIVV